MKTLHASRKSAWLAALVLLADHAPQVFGNPTGLTVGSGQATAQQLGSLLNVTVGQAAILNWQTFNIGAGETTSFLQPSAGSVVFNIIGDKNPSQIFGNLHANGTVILANASGFYFGPNSMIKVGGSFIATTAPLTPDFGAGSTWQFTGMPPLASIVNYGQIEVGHGHSLFLIAENIENHGSLTAPAGDVGLYAGDTVMVSESPDGRGLSAAVTMPKGFVDNFGRITADAGTIALQAKVVNQNGIIQADAIQNQNGVIELVASDSLNLGEDSQILARGDNSTANSSGGTITLKSGNDFRDATGGKISVTGGAHGGDGGNVEISAENLGDIHSQLDGSAQAGFSGGKVLIDPTDLALNSGSLNPYLNMASIVFQASGNITLAANTVWNLSGTTHVNTGQLTLEAGGNIAFGNGAKITDAKNWSVTLDAGYNFANNTISSGVGSIYLNGGSGLNQSGTIQLSSGSVNLFAGQNILVGSGSVYTTGGGSIFAAALTGNLSAGTANGGSSKGGNYNFQSFGYSTASVLGGIATAAGGNVTLIAGNNIDSTATPISGKLAAASGTYGSGNVTVIAGNQITGSYNLGNGVGTMLAGVQASATQVGALQNPNANPANYAATLQALETAVKQSQNAGGNIGSPPSSGNPSTAPVTLGLINGSWNVWAANDVSLKQVINPNGAFNNTQSFLYNYAADAAVSLWAGNAIELVGNSFGNVASSVNVTPIYAPRLSLNAGAGGIQVDNSIILAPSAAGSLSIVTRNGGNLIGAPTADSTVLTGITMSDSGSTDYNTFSSGHAAVPLHLNDPNSQPVLVDISGSIGNISLTVPTFADITVEGNQPFTTSAGKDYFGTYNFAFSGRNLSPDQTTSINVLGAITYRGDVTPINLTADQLADPLPAELFAYSANRAVTDNLRYDLNTGQLIYVGVMSTDAYNFLQNPSVLVLDKNGRPETQLLLGPDGKPALDANGNPQFVNVTKPITLDATQLGVITELYNATKDATLGSQGLAVAGPGHFNVSANTMDLGVSAGITVQVPPVFATSVALADPLPSVLFDPAQSGNPDVAGKLHYDSVSGKLIFAGVMTSADLAFLLNPTKVATDVNGNPTTESVTLDSAQRAAVSQLYAENKKDVMGATLNVTTLGDLSMTSTTIANQGLFGDINLNVGGTLGVGGQFTAYDPPSVPKGIFTTSGGNISITVNGDLNVNGSRIAAYNGGNISLLSKTGDINAGSGGAGYISVSALKFDPQTGQLAVDAFGQPVIINSSIAGSGILATTLPGSEATLGNITINAANGSLNANRGGVLQVAFNGKDTGSFIDVNVGKDINATGSGIIGSNVKLQAGGNINGAVIGSQSVNVDATHGNVDVTVVSGGSVNISAAGTVAGTIIGGGDVNVSGDAITAAISGGSVSASGDTSGASLGVSQSNTGKEVAETTDASNTAATGSSTDEDLKKKKGIALAQKVSRVTVVLPGAKKLSEKTGGNNPL